MTDKSNFVEDGTKLKTLRFICLYWLEIAVELKSKLKIHLTLAVAK